MHQTVTIIAIVNDTQIRTAMRVWVVGGRYCLPADFLPFDIAAATELVVDGKPVRRGSCYESATLPTIVEVTADPTMPEPLVDGRRWNLAEEATEAARLLDEVIEECPAEVRDTAGSNANYIHTASKVLRKLATTFRNTP